jgi:hypothetical protein
LIRVSKLEPHQLFESSPFSLRLLIKRVGLRSVPLAVEISKRKSPGAGSKNLKQKAACMAQAA